MEMLTNYLVPEIVVGCLILGFIIKKWIKDVDNKWIPTIVAIVGVIAAVLTAETLSVAVIAGGALSGLASTGLHQLFKQCIDNGGK